MKCAALLAGSLVLVSLGVGAAGGEQGRAAWRPVAQGAPQAWAGTAGFFPPGPRAPSTRGVTPNSTLPEPGGFCSAFASDGGSPPACSTRQAGLLCSTQCGDLDGGCSAIGDAGGAEPLCSTGGARAVCSVLQPPLVPDQSGLGCSTIHFDAAAASRCSVLTAASKQACSTQNPGDFYHFCSSIAGAGPCSVLNAGAAEPSFCSSFFQGAKLCSADAAVSGPDGVCSVVLGGRGTCTALKGGLAGQCSVVQGTGDCSVIGGAPGALCRQP